MTNLNLFPAEGLMVKATPFSLVVAFSPPGDPRPQLAVALPLVVAKELALLLRKALLDIERQRQKTIEIPAEEYQAMQVAPEDWPNWGSGGGC